ncbi:MAG TPA: hypothetical protein ENN12_00935 [Epsilonproteobacteria bacterium]|nr:hypothetical protein [Campylobacterota bacterium]
MFYAYLRQTSQHSNLSEQQQSIISFSLSQQIMIDKEVVEYSVKSRPIEERKQFESFVHTLQAGDGIIVESLSVLSSQVEELVKIITCFLSRGVDIYTISPFALITKETSVAQVLPLLNDLREAQKVQSTQIGRPKGSKSRSKFDSISLLVIEKLKEGKTVSAIAREFGVSRSSLKDYIESRDMKSLIDGSWMEINKATTHKEASDKLLICPFEKIANSTTVEEN